MRVGGPRVNCYQNNVGQFQCCLAKLLETIDEISKHLLGLDEIKSDSINCYKWNVTALNVILVYFAQKFRPL